MAPSPLRALKSDETASTAPSPFPRPSSTHSIWLTTSANSKPAGDEDAKQGRGRKIRLWNWERTTAWRKVKAVMQDAGLGNGPQVSPKGLRHGFGVAAVTMDVPLNLVQKWLGHAQLSTTAIYADAVGAEEKLIASRMW